MNRALSISIPLILAIAIISIGATKWIERNAQMSPEGLERTRILADRSTAKADVDDRARRLAADGCASRAAALKSLIMQNPAADPAETPADLRSDLQLCLDRGIVGGYIRDDLEKSGAMRLLRPGELAGGRRPLAMMADDEGSFVVPSVIKTVGYPTLNPNNSGEILTERVEGVVRIEIPAEAAAGSVAPTARRG